MKTIKVFIILNLLFTSLYSYADINAFSCEPEWSALIKEIGQEKVSTFSATTGLQDPHRLQARPSLIAKIRQADILICTGADLEIGWLPLLLRRASNTKVQPGNEGHFIATEYARLLGKPKTIDRSQGDIHAAGNPHIHTNPKNILPVARALTVRMKSIDPTNADFYQSGLDDFTKRWKKALKNWKTITKPLQNMPIVVHHASWIYLEDYLKLEQLNVLEGKPGIPPTTGHLSKLLENMKQQPAKVIIHAAYQDSRPAQWLSKKTGIPVVTLPFTIGGSKNATNLFSLYDETFKLLLLEINE